MRLILNRIAVVRDMRPSYGEGAYQCGCLDGTSAMNQETKESPFDPKDFLSKDNGGRTKSDYAIDQAIYHQGDLAVSIFYILTGKVKLTVTSENGKEAIVAVLGVDDFFGEGCADGETLRLSTATALTECTIMEIAKAEFRRTIHNEPAFAEFFISHLLILAVVLVLIWSINCLTQVRNAWRGPS